MYPPPDSAPPQYPETQPPRTVQVALPASKPVVTYTLMGITIVIFLLQLATQSSTGLSDLPATLGAKVNPLIESGQLWRLITPVFLHGSILHIAFNMYALLAIGAGLESHYGHGRFLALYLLSGFTGNVASFLFSSAPSLGASTAIFGLLGAEGVFLYQNRRLFGPTAQRALVNIVVIAVINLIIGLSPGIDNWGHIGGLIGGTLFAWFAGPVLRVEQGYPALELVDQRRSITAITVFTLVWLLFAALAAVKILF